MLPSKLRAIGRSVFENCKYLKSVTLGDGSALERIQVRAFYGSGLELFTAPPLLKRIDAIAFGACHQLRDFRLNEGIQELDWLCLWNAAITDLRIPLCVKRTPEQLGLDQKTPGVLRFPDGLDFAESGWFRGSDVEKVVVPSSVTTLGWELFKDCARLREVVFEPDSRLKRIAFRCFENCGITEIVIPKSVRFIGQRAFAGCQNLSSLRFEEGSRISRIDVNAFQGTQLTPRSVKYPKTFRSDREEW